MRNVKSGISLFFFTFILFTFIQKANSQANYVYHEQTVNNPGCGPNYMSTITPNNVTPLSVAWKVEYQFNTDRVRLYYTIDGTTPAGALGVGSGTTQVVTGSYNCTFGGPVVDVVTATIPAVPSGTIVKYILSAWNTGGGDEIFANGPGAGCACGTPTNNSTLANVFMYTAIATNPVEVTSSGGTAFATYATLAAAFTAINAGTHTGTITTKIVGNTTEPAGGAILNASGAGAASYTTISIQPSGGAARTITGAATAGLPLVDLNGADNVTINGLNTGGNSLTIANTTVSATSITSTIRFIGGATNNTITNCNVQGSGTMAVATNGAVIFFSTDAVTANGNDNNTISNNNIGPAGANLPTKGILGNGSTSTTAIGNSGIIIENNNIFDFFGAAVTSSGVAINGGCNGWSITNNRFYQTGTRTWTTGAVHRAIDLNSSTAISGVQGMTVTGNIIGYASNTQTGTYTMTGSTGKFQGIAFNGIGTGTVSNLNSNTIASVSVTGVTSSGTGSTASPFSAILVNAGLVNTNSNTIGSQSATGSLTFSTTTTTASDFYGIYNFSLDNWTANSNTVGGISVTNLGASGTFTVYGLRANTGTALQFNATSNIIGGTIANSIQLAAPAGSSQIVGMAANSAIANWTSNTIRNLTNNIGTGTTTSASIIGMSTGTSTTPSHTLSQNTIHTLTNTNATVATTVTGIQFTGGTTNVVERNFIYNLLSSTTSNAAEINGIRVGGGTTIYRNNMIALGANQAIAIGAAASNSGTSGINGFNGALGTDAFVHNSVYIGGTATSGSGASYALNGTQTTNTRSFRDNIFFNARSNSGATGKHYAVKINGTSPNPTGLTINNNVYFANGASGAIFGYFNGGDVLNLAAWKTAVGQDAGSFEGNPQYNDPTNATPDLHLHPTNVTVAEGNGVDVGVTNDYDGQTRSGLTPVDIGADAGNFMGVDMTAPVITYTPLSGTCTLTGVTLTATISDAGSGVPTSGAGLPVLYWRVNAGAYAAVTGTFVSGNSYSFGPFGSGAIGDVISYYIVAQDGAATPNLIASPSTGASGFTANPPAAATPPTTPSSFLLQGSIGGDYDVGSGQTYTTITAAIAAYNTSCLTSAVTFNLTDAAYTEAAAMTINANLFASATNTLTIKPTLPNTTIAVTGGSSTAIFILNGADYVTIGGSITPVTNTVCPLASSARDLTITNTNAGTSSTVVWLQTTAGGDAATNNIIRNCNIVGNSNTTTMFGVGSGSATIGLSSLGTANNNNRFENNNISKTQYGIYSQGASAGNKNTGTIINQNLINTVSPNNVARGGIVVGFENNITISGNNVSEMAQAGSPDVFGITLGVQGISTSTFTGNEVTNATVTKNIIGSVRNTGTFSAGGLVVAPATSGTNLIANNMISGVSANGTSGDFSVGMLIGGGAGSTTQIYYNTVNMQGTQTGGSEMSYALAIGGNNPTVDVKNNILVNTQNNGSGLNYAYGLGYSTFTALSSNNNNLFTTTGALYAIGATGSISAPTNAVTLANFQTATGQGLQSVNVSPVFVSTTDLHLIPASNTLLNGAGTAVSVTDDIDCSMRDLSTPDIGADEFTPPVCSGAVAGTASASPTGPFCASGTSIISASGFSFGTGSSYQWQSSVDVGFTSPVNIGSPSAAYANLNTGTITSTTFFRLKVTCTSGTAEDFTASPVQIVIIPSIASISGLSSKCPADPAITLTENGGTGTSWLWNTTETTSVISVNPASTTTYTVTVTSPGSCTTSATKTVVVNPLPPVPTAGSNTPVCQGSTLNLTAANIFVPYSVTNNSGVSFIDISTSGTAVTGALGDDSEHNLTIPSFTFNNIAYTTARVGVNGVVVFGSNSGDITFSNATLPSTSNTAGNIFVAPYWDDLDINLSGNIKTETIGSKYIIQFTNIDHNSFTTGGITFQVQLDLTTSQIHLVYQDVIFGSATYDSGASATIGIQYSGTQATQFSFNTASLTNGQSITYTPSSGSYSWEGPNTFSSLVQNPSISNITLLGAGTYTVTVTNPITTCTNTSSTIVVVNALPTATISYAGNPYCNTGMAMVTQAGQGGGSYGSTGGLSINTGTGEVDLGTSTSGTYTVTYSFTDGTCPNTTTAPVQIEGTIVKSIADAGFNSLRNVYVCIAESGTITYDQPTTATTVLTAPLDFTKSVTIQGMDSSNRPVITLPAAGSAISALKTLTLRNVDINSPGTTFTGSGDVIIDTNATTVIKQ